jgi:hypothetical protein
VRTPRKAASVLPSKHSSTTTVGEVLAHVQGESLKADTALLARLLNSPTTSWGGRIMTKGFWIAISVVFIQISAQSHAQTGPTQAYRRQVADCAYEMVMKYQADHPNEGVLAAFGGTHDPLIEMAMSRFMEGNNIEEDCLKLESNWIAMRKALNSSTGR